MTKSKSAPMTPIVASVKRGAMSTSPGMLSEPISLCSRFSQASAVAMKTMSVVEAKAHFAEAVRSAEGGEPVVIERHGEAVAAIVSARDLRLLSTRRVTGETGTLLGLAELDGVEAFAEELEVTVRARGATRDLPGLE